MSKKQYACRIRGETGWNREDVSANSPSDAAKEFVKSYDTNDYRPEVIIVKDGGVFMVVVARNYLVTKISK